MSDTRPHREDTFPRQYARTQRLTLGEPRTLTVTPDGSRVLFLRSTTGDDPVHRLWEIDAETGAERLVADPAALLAADADADLPPEERARRERLREGAVGITSYALDEQAATAAFALGGQLFVADVGKGETVRIEVPGPVFDPRPSPDGASIAYVRGRSLWITDREGSSRELAGETTDETADSVSWGGAEFIAAEEMGRFRGFWWSPDGSTIAVCRVDTAAVPIWHIADPASPANPPVANRYPAAGTANADVSLHLIDVASRSMTHVDWDAAALPYLAAVVWNDHGLTTMLQTRDQRRLEIRSVDLATGATDTVWEDLDDVWVELVPGTGGLIAPGVVVVCADREGARRLVVGGDVVSPDDVQIRAVISADADRVIVTGNPIDDATVQHVYRWADEELSAITHDPGVHSAVAGGETVVVRTTTLDRPGGRWRLPSGFEIAGSAERPLVSPNVTLAHRASDISRDAVLLPHDHDGSTLPVLLDPYGGPHAQRVVRSYHAFCTSQWFADQGFAVVVADNRGTPGRGSEFERAVRNDLATGVLADQVDALHAAAERHPELDLGRVAIRGWSFGGYLAALAVLRRPDVFHAAIAGAPVTEWRLYDTHYTERYLGDPNAQPDVYDASSLLPIASRLSRPLLLIHGLADDNVVAAHTLQLSAALLAAGRPHEVLPLVGVTHMTPQEEVAENLLLHQLDFLRRSLPAARSN